MTKNILFLLLLLMKAPVLYGVVIPIDSQVDEDGTQIITPKYAPKGWTYMARAIEIQTSQLDSVYSKQYDGTNWGDVTLKCYNSSDVEITVQSTADTDCVKTVVDWEPIYNYSIVGASATVDASFTGDLRVWALAVPDIPYSLGGSKRMISGVNMRFHGAKETFEFDGRTSKRMLYDATYHTNKIRIFYKHNAGEKINVMVIWNHYRA